MKQRLTLVLLLGASAIIGASCTSSPDDTVSDDATPGQNDTSFGITGDGANGSGVDGVEGAGVDGAGGTGPTPDSVGAGGSDPGGSDAGAPDPTTSDAGGVDFGDTTLPPVDDAVVEPPDPTLDKQPLAGVCSSGVDCATGDCNSGYSGGYCTVWCDSNDDCPAGAKCYDDPNSGLKMCWKECSAQADCRSDQFCAGVCTPKCQTGSCQLGYECDTVGGLCQPTSPVECVPEPELCGDGLDQSCDDIIDEGCGPVIADNPNVELVDLGLVNVGGGGLSPTLKISVDDDVDSFTILVIDADGGDQVMAIWELRDPSGALLANATDPLEAPLRSLPDIGALTMQLPNTSTLAVTSGTYEFTVYREGTLGQAWVYVLLNRRIDAALAAEASTLDINYWFVGLPAIDAAKAQTNIKFQSMLSLFEDVLVAHGINIGSTAYFDVTGPAAQQYSVVDVVNESYTVDEHAQLLALSEGISKSNRGVNFFFVQGFTGWGILGRAGGIPGPPLLHGTYHSGVVVSLIDYYGWPGQYGISATAEAMAHELGHQLGLFHTSEQNGSLHDPIPDTPECVDDWNGDGLLSVEECEDKDAGNLMFWSTNLSADLSTGQKYVIHRNASLY